MVEGGPRDAAPIVLIHCFTCAIDWWDGMRPRLEADHRVVAIDLLGHGGSEKPDSGYTPENQAKLVAEALSKLMSAMPRSSATRWGAPSRSLSPSRIPQLVDRVAIIDMPPDNSYGDLGFIAGLAFQPVLGEALWTIKPDFSIKDGLGVAFAPGLRRARCLRRRRQADDLHRLRRIAQRKRGLHRRRVSGPANASHWQAIARADGGRGADRQRPAASAGSVRERGPGRQDPADRRRWPLPQRREAGPDRAPRTRICQDDPEAVGSADETDGAWPAATAKLPTASQSRFWGSQRYWRTGSAATWAYRMPERILRDGCKPRCSRDLPSEAPVPYELMFDSKKNLTARLTNAADLMIDFATLGEYGLEPVGEAASACETRHRFPPTPTTPRPRRLGAPTLVLASENPAARRRHPIDGPFLLRP